MKPFYRVDAEYLRGLLIEHSLNSTNLSISAVIAIIEKHFPLITPMSESEIDAEAEKYEKAFTDPYGSEAIGFSAGACEMQERIFGKGE